MNPPTTARPSRQSPLVPKDDARCPVPPPPLTEAEQRERAVYIERNLWLAFIGLLLFALALWGA